ncbi:MAG: hypothetical protein QOI95_254 [Acidimicrobiaceae bacterium]|jgi:hypothetical protein
MTAQSDVPEDPSEWQFSAPQASSTVGPGLLQRVLDEVSALRTGAANDRAALAEALGVTFEDFARQLADVRDVIQQAIEGDDDDDAERAELAAQNDAMVLAVTSDLRAELASVEQMITDSVKQVAAELRTLRQALLGSDQ